jgi:hypothetical protein
MNETFFWVFVAWESSKLFETKIYLLHEYDALCLKCIVFVFCTRWRKFWYLIRFSKSSKSKILNKEKITLNIFKKVTSLHIKKSMKKTYFKLKLIQKLRFFQNLKNRWWFKLLSKICRTNFFKTTSYIKLFRSWLLTNILFFFYFRYVYCSNNGQYGKVQNRLIYNIILPETNYDNVNISNTF